jgi:hypothetical protein
VSVALGAEPSVPDGLGVGAASAAVVAPPAARIAAVPSPRKIGLRTGRDRTDSTSVASPWIVQHSEVLNGTQSKSCQHEPTKQINDWFRDVCPG